MAGVIRQSLALALFAACSPAADESRFPQPYAGRQARAIKALSVEEVDAYLAGEGMGYALAAELNHYPGPRHVLDLAEPLDLSSAQHARTEAIYGRMHAEAVTLGAEIVARETTLDSSFARANVNGIAALEGRLRTVHLGAHLEMRQLLSVEQVARYDRMRGYESNGHEHEDQRPRIDAVTR